MSWLSRPDRLWALGGVFTCVALLALAWLLLISPQRTETGDLATSTEDTLARVSVEQRELTRRAEEFEHLDRYQGQLTAARRALPRAPQLADFLRELQTAGEAAGVTVSSFAAGNPVDTKAANAQIYSITVSVNAEGSLDRLQAFCTQLQQTQPRAVLIIGMNLAPSGDASDLAANARLSLTAQIFMDLQATTTPVGPGEQTTTTD